MAHMAERIRKVSSMTLLRLTGMRAEVLLSCADARIARPMRVRSRTD